MAALSYIHLFSRNICRNVLPVQTLQCFGLVRGIATLSVSERNSQPKISQTKNQSILSPNIPQLQITRSTNFFNRLPAEQIWKGVTGVSNAGKKRGRGRGAGKKMGKDLNRGQIIGLGEVNMKWPGLNCPVIQGKEVIKMQKLPKNEEREELILKMRRNMGTFRRFNIDPLDRGWSGTKLPGRSIGPPDPIGDETFEGFDTKVLEYKTVTNMSGIFGRVKRLSIFVVTGNRNGLAGFALAKGSTGKGAMTQGKNKAGQKLMYFERYNDHTIMHDFFSQFGATKVFAKKMPEGYGLVCHRVIRTICEVIGIKDIHCKVEGSVKNTQNLTKAFFLGLMRQKSHKEIAEDKQLHLVEFRDECLNFPKVMASPESSPVRTLDQISNDEEMDFNIHIMDGKLPLQRKKFPKFYTKYYGWEIHKKKLRKSRNHEKIRLQLLTEYGEIRSFLADKYPECRAGYVHKVEEEY